MTWRDIPALAALEPALFAGDPWSEQTWWAELAGRPRRCYVVAERGTVMERGTVTGRRGVVGYAGLDCGGEVADVMTIAVAPEAQGQGLGDALVGWLIRAARGGGAKHLMLEVRADNVAAQQLYAKAGFEMVSRRRRYYQPGDVDAHIMRLSLEGSADGVAGASDGVAEAADGVTEATDGVTQEVSQ